MKSSLGAEGKALSSNPGMAKRERKQKNYDSAVIK
jgi:hypothetical protein